MFFITIFLIFWVNSSTAQPHEADRIEKTANKNDKFDAPDIPKKANEGDIPKNGELFEGDIVMDERLRKAIWTVSGEEIEEIDRAEKPKRISTKTIIK